MAIDWMNPIADVLAARDIGYEAGFGSRDAEVAALTERAKEAEAGSDFEENLKILAVQQRDKAQAEVKRLREALETIMRDAEAGAATANTGDEWAGVTLCDLGALRQAKQALEGAEPESEGDHA